MVSHDTVRTCLLVTNDTHPASKTTLDLPQTFNKVTDEA